VQQDLQVLARVRDRLPDLAGEVVHAALTLGEHVDQLGPAAAAQRLAHRRQRVVERVLRLPAAHAHLAFQGFV
jgi:hypothetical protein